MGPMQRDMLGELRRRYDADMAEAGLAALREEIAHELAEQQRAYVARRFDGGRGAITPIGCYQVIDLIDPEVE